MKILNIVIDDYGFTLDSQLFYVALSWEIIVTTVLLVIAYKIYKIWRNK